MAKDALHHRRDVAAQLMHDAPCGIAVTDPDGRLEYMNCTLSRWLGLGDIEPGTLRLADLLAPPGHLFYETHMAPMMRLQGFVREISCRLRVSDGTPLPVMLSGKARRDAAGQPIRFDYTVFDARERRGYEDELRRARREADELAAIVRSSPNPILRIDSAGRIRNWNNGATNNFGVVSDIAQGQPLSETITLIDIDDWFAHAVELCGSQPEAVFEARHASGREFEITVAPIGRRRHVSGEGDWSIVMRDITDRKLAERRLNVMVDEMRHRVKNTLGVVTSMARQTLPGPAGREFISRLQALSQAHDALIRTDWGGATLRELLGLAQKEAGGPGRFRFDGPDMDLSPQQTTSLSMALHELVTNALKYGALTTPEGYVDVASGWSGDAEADRRLRLVWQEHGGPQVAQPTRTGFGTTMIGMVLGSDLAADVSMEFPPEGFRCVIVFSAGEPA